MTNRERCEGSGCGLGMCLEEEKSHKTPRLRWLDSGPRIDISFLLI